ncbi:hypothetical protein D6D24_10582 [Aureobasidium pullulans]|uniref:Cytochrome P450 n=1 Tax=Aureobasidium pullulans TaxID=5580 RepID=A0A4S8V218_AURPU|nr:hypothetical protein D6D24_10582 [Aureobasidium pullulans]
MIGHILRNNETKKAPPAARPLRVCLPARSTSCSLIPPVVKEVRDSFSLAEDITWANVSKLTYLEATVNEALRLVAERHPKNFTDPKKFEPERWLGVERYKHNKLYASQPFSLGVRACISKNLSYFKSEVAKEACAK